MKSLINRKINLGFGVALLILCTIGVISFRSTSGMVETTKMMDRSHEVLIELEELLSQMRETSRGVKSYVTTGDERSLEPYYETSKHIDEKIKSLRDLTGDNPHRQEQFDALQALITSALAKYKNRIELAKKGQREIKSQQSQSNQAVGSYDQIRTKIREIEREERALVKNQSTVAEASARRTNRIITFGSLLAFALVALSGVVVNRDLTKRKRAEEEQKRLQDERDQLLEQLRLQIDLMPIGFMLTDADFRSTYWNPAAESIFGFTNGEVRGTHDYKLIVPPDSVTSVEETFKRIAAGETISNSSGNNLTKDGRSITCDWYSTALRKADGTFIGIMSMVQDVTERTQAETIRAKLEAQLRQSQKMEAIGTLAGGIAHDFNNILGAIIGFSELALMDLPKNHSAEVHLAEVLKASNRAKELVQQILTFSRQEEHERKPLQLIPVLKETLKLLRATIPSTIEIRQEIDPQAPSILGDPTQIHQVMMNLGTNAWHAMDEHGGIMEIKLSTFDVDADFARSHADLREGRYLRLIVSDTGCGMDRSTLERIFEPFFTTKPPGAGTGLGLAVVHGIVKRHEGAISVYSEPEKGTTFNLYFPVHDIDARATIQESNSLPMGEGQHILFVDDEEPLASIGKSMLERMGYRVTTKTSSAEALATFNAQPYDFDLVITDQTMPNMSGADLAKMFLEIRPELPVILSTGFSTTINPEKAHAIGIREMLLKPNTAQSLSEAIRRALGSRRKE